MNNKLASATGNKIEILKMDKKAVRDIGLTIKALLGESAYNEDLDFLRYAYDYMGLHDNKRIMEMSKRNYKADLSINQNILEDMIAVIEEEITVCHNDELLELLIEHYMNKYPSIESEMKKYDTVCDYIAAYTGNEQDIYSFTLLCYLVSGRVTETDLKRFKLLPNYTADREDLPCIKSQLAVKLGVQNLDQNKLYQKFILEKKKEVCDYLKTDTGRFEDCIMELFFKLETIAGKNGRICTMIKNVYSMIWHGNMNAGFIASQDKSAQKQTVNRAFETVCVELVADSMCKNHGLEISQINRLVRIEDMNAFFCIFFSAVMFEFCSERTGFAVNECYEDFSFGDLCTDREKELLVKIDTLKRQHKDKTGRLQAELNEKNEKLVRLVEQGFESRQKEQSAVDKQTAEYKKEISRLKKQMDNIQHDLEDAKKQVQSRDEFIKVLSASEDDVADDTEIDMQKLWTKRYLFVGNVKEAMPYLKEDFSDSIFMDNENYNLKNIKVDKVIVFTGYISHGMFYKIKNVLKDVPVIWCNSKNKDIVYRKMQKAV